MEFFLTGMRRFLQSSLCRAHGMVAGGLVGRQRSLFGLAGSRPIVDGGSGINEWESVARVL
jgi:hypothetical protein